MQQPDLDKALRDGLASGDSTPLVEGPEIVPGVQTIDVPICSGNKYTKEEIYDLFHYHKPSNRGVNQHQTLSHFFVDLAETVDAVCPNGREKSIAFTKLEEAKMWASAAVARNPETR